MPVTYSATPPVGVTPGDLRVDSASRTLWLGVATSVDPDGALLISDIVALEAEIAAAEARANDYTDAQLLTRAPVSHTHVAADITDFEAEVTAIATSIPQLQWIPGMIVMWSGSLVEIGVGDLLGWHLCDGLSGTPDLRSRFIIGAGHLGVGSTNPLAAAPTNATGGHSHGGVTGNTTLTTAQIPSHLHNDGTLAGVANGNTGSAGAHTHTTPMSGSTADGSFGRTSNGTGVNVQSSSDGVHTHPISNVAVSISGNTGSAGGGGAHSHPITAQADHSHTISSNNLRDASPYFALAYIMKLP